MDYLKYTYIYLPRPKFAIASTSLSEFEDGNYIGQPKLNGSSMQVYTNGKIATTMNRHKQAMSHKMKEKELINLHRGNGWMVICGEYMNKNQTDECNVPWNHKFIVFDILVYESKYLLGTSFDDRFELLRKLYPDNLVKKHIHGISENCFRVNSMRFGFTNIFKDITKHQMYEGLVLKLGDSKLESGWTEQNNTKTQIKCRKTTKNYAF